MKRVKAFQCDHCNFVRITPRNTRRHESRCHHNEANRGCGTCSHYDKVDSDYDVYLGDGEVDSRTRKVGWCAAKDVEVPKWIFRCDKWTPFVNRPYR